MAAKKKAKKNGGPGLALAAGAAAASVAAGYYFYGTKKAKQHRKQAVKWAHEMKTDVVRGAKKLQKLDESIMHGIVDQIADAYKSGKKMDPKAVKAAAEELKRNWRKVRSELAPAKKAVKKAVKRAVKRTARK